MMYHSIAFLSPADMNGGINDTYSHAEKNTWNDWHLIPSTRPSVSPPQPRINLVELPGVNGAIDLSEYFNEEITYSNRTGSWEFIVANGYDPWDIVYSKILTYLQGQRKVCILEDDKANFYEGRFSVSEWKSDPKYSLITIDYSINPYKKSVQNPREPWLWDPFDFVVGVVPASTLNEDRKGSL